MTKNKEENTEGKTYPCKKGNIKNRGWTEPEKNEEGKAKRHSDVAVRAASKERLNETLRTPMKVATEPEPKPVRRAPFRIRGLFSQKPEDVEEPVPEEEADLIPRAGAEIEEKDEPKPEGIEVDDK